MSIKINNKKRSAPIRSVYFIAITFCICYLVFGIAFVLYSGYLSKQVTIDHINEATEQTVFVIESHNKEEFNSLLAATAFIEGNDLITPESWITEISNILEEENNYVSMGISNASGQAVIVEGDRTWQKADITGEEYFQRAILGEKVLLAARYDEKNKKMVNDSAIPVYAGKKIIGILFAAKSEDELRNVAANALFAGRGIVHIVNDNGDYVVNSERTPKIKDASNIFDVDPLFSKHEELLLLENMAKKKSGHLEILSEGENKVLAYAPLNINGWYVFYLVPEYQAIAGLKFIETGSMTIITSAVVIFMLFLFLIRSINNKRRLELEKLAYEDPLTGQRNFRKFLHDARLLLVKNQELSYALWYFDIKEFRYFNDLFGHKGGNRLLLCWANCLSKSLRPEEVFGRANADTFVALRVFSSTNEIEKRFNDEVVFLNDCPEVAQRGYQIDMSVGIYLINEDEDKQTLEDMLDHATVALKSVKTMDGSRIGYYSKEMRESKLEETRMLARMECALKKREFVVYFQAKIDIQHGDFVMGMEALARWIPAEGDVISPSKFIRIFEENGFIVKLDRYIFESACRQYKEVFLDKSSPPLVMSVNVSRLGIMLPDFIETYAGIADKYGVPKNLIELEFTESLALDNRQLFQSIISQSKSQGFLCSLDDFGAGYSSLNILKSLKVDVLKLDRLLFQYGEDANRGAELVKNIISMAKALNMKTVAEGIDSWEQVAQLRQMGCDIIQGYIFSEPMSEVEFKKFLAKPEFCSIIERH